MELIRGTSAPEVWLAACEYLQKMPDHEDFDVILHITAPSPLSKADAQVLAGVNKFLVGHGGASVDTVAETIFPLQDYVRGGKPRSSKPIQSEWLRFMPSARTSSGGIMPCASFDRRIGTERSTTH